MRTEQEIQEALIQMQNTPPPMQPYCEQYIYMGVIRALDWVLNDKSKENIEWM